MFTEQKRCRHWDFVLHEERIMKIKALGFVFIALSAIMIAGCSNDTMSKEDLKTMTTKQTGGPPPEAQKIIAEKMAQSEKARSAATPSGDAK